MAAGSLLRSARKEAVALLLLAFINPSLAWLVQPALLPYQPASNLVYRPTFRSPCCCASEAESTPSPPEGISVPAVPVAPASSGPGSQLTRARAWFGKWWKFDKKQLANLGVNAFFSYGFVSNVNVGLTIALAWGTFARSSGFSPLAPGQWNKFLRVYLGIYATVGTVLRPFRIAFAVSITPAYGKVIDLLKNRLPFKDSRPKLNRAIAVFIVTILGNIVLTWLVTLMGIWLGSLLTGVPIAPVGWRPRDLFSK